MSWAAQIEQHSRSSKANWLKNLRQHALNEFNSKGLPTRHMEPWKHTKLSLIPSNPLQWPQQKTELLGFGLKLEPKKILDHVLKGLDCYLVTFVDGHINESLSNFPKDQGVQFSSIGHLSDEDVVSFKTKSSQHGVHSINAALFQTGIFLKLDKNAVLTKPFVLFHLSSENKSPTMKHLRHFIVAGEKSQATIIEFHMGFNSNDEFETSYLNLVAQPDSNILHFKIQEASMSSTHMGTLDAKLEAGAVLRSYLLNWGGRLARQEYYVALDGKGADCSLKGLFFGKNEQNSEVIIDLQHNSSNTKSEQNFKGVLEDKAHGVFYGKILVQKDAQKINADQSNKNILLSDDAIVNTRPQLEIYADDVKCSHGATIGRLDEGALFYLRSRGIGKKEAEHMLLLGFAEEILIDIDQKLIPIKDRLHHLLEATL
ncbi:MAG: Fe-S cluster assembly protein SufD [Oligoflexia bacterium]|nr:Fe-S cluster assembly protein SufD [Oligoflexia bacterium]